MKELRSLKAQAQKCEVDAAPYLHPHLSAVSANANIKGGRNLLIEEGMTVDQAASLYMATINDPEMLLHEKCCSSKRTGNPVFVPLL
jgi:hypothetical protein